MIRTERVIARPAALRTVWWLHPAIGFSAPAVLASVTAYYTGSKDYLYFWRTTKYFDRSCLDLLLLTVAVFVCGCVIGTARRSRSVSAADWRLAVRWPAVRLCFTISFFFTVVAYTLWILIGIKNGLNLGIVMDIIHKSNSADYNLRDDFFKTIPGLTTGTQFGIAVMALAAPLAAAIGWRRVRWQCGIVLALAVLRSFLNSERLAIIELLVPFAISFIWIQPARTRLLRTLTKAAPLLATGFLYLLFSAGEYYRSWASFYARSESNFWAFMGLRLMGYYTTALNNGALVWRYNKPFNLHFPMVTLDFLWRFPVLKDALFVLFPELTRLAVTAPDESYQNLLTSSANPEFNNTSGVFLPYIDYGIAGGLLYWLVAGLICGYLYTEFKRRTVSGVFLYPALYISLIEATRVLYWADGRFLPGMAVLLFGVLLLFKRKLSMQNARASQSSLAEQAG